MTHTLAIVVEGYIFNDSSISNAHPELRAHRKGAQNLGQLPQVWTVGGLIPLRPRPWPGFNAVATVSTCCRPVVSVRTPSTRHSDRRPGCRMKSRLRGEGEGGLRPLFFLEIRRSSPKHQRSGLKSVCLREPPNAPAARSRKTADSFAA